MSLLVNRRTRVIRNVVTHISRKLPAKGEIFASLNQEVKPSDILGRATISPGFRNINLAEELSVSPIEARKCLQRQIGQSIFKGELLAFKQGGFLRGKRIVTSPSDGLLDFYDDKTGELKIEFTPLKVDIPAAVYGLVEKIDKLRGEVIIKTQTTQIFGVFGTGKLREGILKIVGGRDDLTDKSRISANLEGHIVVTGGLIYRDALSRAVAVGVHGIITGGINAEDYRGMTGGHLPFPSKLGGDVGIGVLVSEGFGSISIGEDIFSVLKEYDNQFVILDGNRARLLLPSCNSDCLVQIRKVALPGLEASNLVEPLKEVEAVELSVGQMVRLISAPFIGMQGKVMQIDQTVTELPSGVKTFLVTVQSKSRKIKVPYSNIEIIN